MPVPSPRSTSKFLTQNPQGDLGVLLWGLKCPIKWTYVRYSGHMDFSNNISSIFPGSQSVVLEELLRTARPVTGRQLALQLGDKLGKSRVFEVLHQLAEQDLVVREVVGASHLYSINQKHLCYELMKSLTQPRDLLISFIARQIGRWSPKPEASLLFGSIARGNAKPGSDVDLLLIRPNRVREDDDSWQDQLFRLTLAVQRATGNDLNYLDYSQAEMASLAKSGARLVRELNQHGVVITGEFTYRVAKAG